ncbi:MAG TPA: RNA 2',3'-cyclic phosphodiesterase [Candidatus Marinimicrobia bacterium]|nr:RNA 2',3'-cyclic phosphodiesterase [Candidatus Neomarinimicrobiota bacterium]
MKRTFLAVNVSDETRQLIVSLHQELHFSKQYIRFVSPKTVHVTLKFLGDVKTEIIPDIIANIESSIRSIQKFDYICSGTGVFPNVNKPRILWLGITKGSDILAGISKTLNQALVNMPVKKEDREFRSHITLGRIKETRKSLPDIDRFTKYSFDPIVNHVDQIILYESILTSQGAIHKPLHKFLLK